MVARNAAPDLRTGPVRVRVPATSANLGPGFDSLGLALGIHDEVTASASSEPGLRVEVLGAEPVARDESNLVVRAMRAVFELLDGQPTGITLSCANRIPHGRGLGSSAAAIVAGVVTARALVVDGDMRLPDKALLSLASSLEGHPDNVAACLLGGLTIAWTVEGRASAIRLDCDASVRPVLLIPPVRSATAQARRLLPLDVPHRDAAFNAARSALLVAALTGRPDALLDATEDRLHQSYRSTVAPQSSQLLATLRRAGVPAVISGAGPSVLALTRDATERASTVDQLPRGWTMAAPPIDQVGAELIA